MHEVQSVTLVLQFKQGEVQEMQLFPTNEDPALQEVQFEALVVHVAQVPEQTGQLFPER